MNALSQARRALNAEYLASLPAQRTLRKEELERALLICNLLNAMRESFGMGDIASMEAAGLEAPYCRYLHDVPNIPDAAIEFFRQALLPNSDFRRARRAQRETKKAPA